MLIILIVLLSISILSLIILSYLLISNHRQLLHLKKLYAEINTEFTKVIEREHAQNIQNVELQNQIDANLFKDALTGLISRHIFEDRLDQVINESQRHQLLFAVLFLNVDSLKIVNDALGLDVGDQLLRETALRLQSCIRQLDTVSRFGGDEFVIILPKLAKPETAAYVAQRLLDAVAQPFKINEQEVFVTASIGVAIYPADGENAKLLLKSADNALHQAKSRGYNTYQFYQKSMQVISQRELVLSSSLHNQNIYKDLLIYYQPQVNVEEKKIFSMEAILRWKHPDFGLIDLKDFLRLVEKSGNQNQIAEWFLRNTCQQFHSWKSLGFFVQSISINVSIYQLENPHFAYKVSQILEEYKISPSCLILEICETLIHKKLGMSEKTILMLKEMGIRISLSEFGTGDTALWQLRAIPVDTLKIAGSLIQDMMVNHDTAEIVKTIISLANTLRLQVIASGVETNKQMQTLKTMNCHLMQGNYFNPPILPQEFTMLVEKSIMENV